MKLLISTVAVVTSLVSALTLGIAWFRPSYPGWRSWSLGLAALVAGLLVGFFRTPDSLLAAVLWGNGLIMVGAALIVGAFQRFAGAATGHNRLAVDGAVILILLLALLTLIQNEQLAARFLLVAGYLAFKAGQLVALIVQQRRQRPALRGAYTFNLLVFLLAGALTLPRTLMMGSGLHQDEAFAFTLPNVLMNLATVLGSVGGTLAFWVLHDDRRKAEVTALHHQLMNLAYYDPLTSVLNRRGLWESFERWSAGGRGRAGHPAADGH